MLRRTILLLTTAFVAFAALPDVIKTDNGQVSGTTGKDPSVRVFKGIPFAAPPTGENRWKAPQPAAKWDGVKKADTFSLTCTTGAGGGAGKGGKGGGKGGPPTSGEDCLYLNVWTTAQAANEKRPVIVWTYGGGFTGGSGSEPRYDGEALSKKGVIIVTYNYRLGAMGWFAHPDLAKESSHKVSGNYGMLDMLAALHWVQKNIAAFGGDPNKVTIDGESAGAIAVAAMVGSPEYKGLFLRAMAQSGAWMGLSMTKMRTRQQAEEAGAKAAGSNTIAQLRAMSLEELGQNLRGVQAGPIVDGWLIPEDQSITFSKGQQNKVDILVGSNSDEGTFAGFGRPVTAEQAQRYGDDATDFTHLYPFGSTEEGTKSGLMLVRDQVAWHMRTWAEMQSKAGKKAYVYYFSRVTPGQEARGATHTAELAYMFGNPPAQGWTDVDRQLSDQMMNYWVNFASTGDPNGKNLPPWQAYNATKNDGQAMVFGNTAGFGPQVDVSRLKFLDHQYHKLMTQ
jgi:para-nitrobenzyl esterase